MTTTRLPDLSRRSVLRASLVALSVSALPACAGGGGGQRLRTAPSFDRKLHIPPVLEGTVAPDGHREFELVAGEGTWDFGTAQRTPTWGFNGPHLGPTLRARVEEDVRVRVSNELDEPTSVHWHGMHLPAEMDGGPHQPIDAGGTWQPQWHVSQEPATLWYHPHPHGDTERHVYNGLAGLFIVDPADGPDERLPHDYGVDDLPVVVQDKRLDDSGELDLDDNGNEIGFLGDRVVVNGTWGGYVDVTTDLVRLRVLNGSTARTYNLGFSDDRQFHLIATDGGLRETPLATSRVQVSPGERVEIVVAVRPGDVCRLATFRADLGAVVLPSAFGADDEVDLLELRAARSLRRHPALPTALATIPWLDAGDSTSHRELVFEGREINGRRMDMDRIDLQVPVDSQETWEVRSRNPFPHNFHVHDVQFQVVAVDGKAPPPELRGWKDTVYLAPQVTYRLVMQFRDYASPTHPYMYHCHLLLHEDDGMMGQFLVVDGDGDAAEDEPAGTEVGGGDSGSAHDLHEGH